MGLDSGRRAELVRVRGRGLAPGERIHLQRVRDSRQGVGRVFGAGWFGRGYVRPSSSPGPGLAGNPSIQSGGTRDPAAARHRPRDRRSADLQRGRQPSRSSSTARSTTTGSFAPSWRAAGTRSRTTGDTEVIVHLYEEHGRGPRRAPATGCSRSRSGTRPRAPPAGARPGRQEAALLRAARTASSSFASELRALLRTGSRSRARSTRRRVDCYLAYGYIPAPWTIWRGRAQAASGSHARPGRTERCRARAAYWWLDYSTKRRGRLQTSSRRSSASRLAQPSGAG